MENTLLLSTVFRVSQILGFSVVVLNSITFFKKSAKTSVLYIPKTLGTMYLDTLFIPYFELGHCRIAGGSLNLRRALYARAAVPWCPPTV